jgi:2-keto-4-pentenoate hydratase/2-oxohepta-3-ene-1,7-dioic acid hydratase in catechol pathway
MTTHEAILWIIDGDGAYSTENIAGAARYDKLDIFRDMSTFLAEDGLTLLQRWVSDGLLSRVESVSIEKIHWLAPISLRSKILCSVVNFIGHGEEVNRKPPSQPFLFLKASSALNGPFDQIVKPQWAGRMDYETELAFMIGKPAKDVNATSALSHIAGYFVTNDISFRDLQWNKGHEDLTEAYGQNWVQGKSLDTAFPAGPWLVTIDECGHGPFVIKCRINGEKVQHASSSEMIYGPSEFISHISQGMTLWPGDVISMGSPKGTPLSNGRRYLEHGDKIESEISGLGIMKNTIVAAQISR